MGLEKALITNTATGASVPVMFNPAEYTLTKDVSYAAAGVPGLSAPIVQFVHGNAQTLEMELFLDTYEAGGDVRQETQKITTLMAVDPSLHAPPPCIFAWGSLSFTCVVARVAQQFVMFRPDGIPVRARLRVLLTEYTNVDLEAKEIKRETADYSRLVVTGAHDNLSAVAFRAYQNPATWRPIALRNGIDDPRDVPAGLRLLVPQLPFRDPDTGEVMQ